MKQTYQIKDSKTSNIPGANFEIWCFTKYMFLSFFSKLKMLEKRFESPRCFRGCNVFLSNSSHCFSSYQFLRGLKYYHETHHQITSLLSVTSLKIIIFKFVLKQETSFQVSKKVQKSLPCENDDLELPNVEISIHKSINI